MSDTTIPSFARVKRVQDIVASDKALKSKLSAKSETVAKRNGDKAKFSPEVIQIAQAIQDAGQDAASIPKGELLQHAQAVLEGGTPPAAPAPEAPADDKADTTEAPAAEAETPAPAAKGKFKADPSICILNLLLGAEQLAEADKNPGADGRRKELGAVIKKYSDLVNGTAG